MDLMVTYYGGERGRRFEILANDRSIASVVLNGQDRDQFVDVIYPIPAESVAADGSVTIRFVARNGSRAGAVYGVRLLKRP